jgi:hypothetical protein
MTEDTVGLPLVEETLKIYINAIAQLFIPDTKITLMIQAPNDPTHEATLLISSNESNEDIIGAMKFLMDNVESRDL